MKLPLNNVRFWLAALLAPLLLPLLIMIFFKLRGVSGINMNLHDLWQFLYFTMYRSWPVVIMLYVGHLFLLVPLCQALKRRNKLKLSIYLPAGYLIGGLTNTIGYAFIEPDMYSLQYLSSMVLIMFISGGTYGFFHAALFWYVAGLHLHKEKEYAIQR